MQVFKFGGASVVDADGVKNISNIITQYAFGKTVVVVSAMGKTTNKLEDILLTGMENKSSTEKIDSLKDYHSGIANKLFDRRHAVFQKIGLIFDKLHKDLRDADFNRYFFDYDRVVSAGEYLSTVIVSSYLYQQGMKSYLMNAGDIIKTTSEHGSAKILWPETRAEIYTRLKPVVEKQLVVTQGFIGQDTHDNVTTLGREGSDYTAAVIANCLNAESVTVWKDVAGVMSADPRKYPDAKLLPRLTYQQAWEMASNGAQILHKDTMQPMEKKGIPLYVRSFVNPNQPGTVICKPD